MTSPDLGRQVFEFVSGVLSARTRVGIFVNREIEPLILAELALDHQVFGVDFVDNPLDFFD